MAYVELITSWHPSDGQVKEERWCCHGCEEIDLEIVHSDGCEDRKKKLDVSGKSNEIAEGLPEHDLWMHHFHSFPKEPTSGPVETWRSLSKIGSRAMRSHLSIQGPTPIYLYNLYIFLYIQSIH